MAAEPQTHFHTIHRQRWIPTAGILFWPNMKQRMREKWCYAPSHTAGRTRPHTRLHETWPINYGCPGGGHRRTLGQRLWGKEAEEQRGRKDGETPTQAEGSGGGGGGGRSGVCGLNEKYRKTHPACKLKAHFNHVHTVSDVVQRY